MSENNNVVSVSVCPSCHKLTTMKASLDDKVFFCVLCFEEFTQYKNGKLVYIPIGLAQAMGNKLSFVFSSDFKLQDEIRDDLEIDFEVDFDFEPDEIN